jgi:hypothetical protein
LDFFNVISALMISGRACQQQQQDNAHYVHCCDLLLLLLLNVTCPSVHALCCLLPSCYAMSHESKDVGEVEFFGAIKQQINGYGKVAWSRRSRKEGLSPPI